MNTPQVLRVTADIDKEELARLMRAVGDADDPYMLIIQADLDPQGIEIFSNELRATFPDMPKTFIICLGEDADIEWVPAAQVAFVAP